jgi:MFS family permease
MLQLNMQAAFLISSKSFSEHQVSVLFFVFSLFQFLFLFPSGYLLDYSGRKIEWVIWAGCGTSAITVITALAARDFGENMPLMIILKMLQGSITAILVPGFNSLTLGIVGATGFTHQVSRNRMMNHLGTALIVGTGSLIAYFLFPNIGNLFFVSPLAAMGLYYNLRRIRRSHVNIAAARSLIVTSPTMTEYENMDEENELIWMASGRSVDDWMAIDETDLQKDSSDGTRAYLPPVVHIQTNTADKRVLMQCSEDERETSSERQNEYSVDETTKESVLKSSPFFFGWARPPVAKVLSNRVQSPLSVLMDQDLIIFTAVIFFFNLSNASVLPLVMQSLSLKDPQAGILLSALCIVIAQACMAFLAKLCGDFSPLWGRKNLFLIGLVSLPIRCFLLCGLVAHQDTLEEKEDDSGSIILKALILATQILDSVGAGILGTLYILITNDISLGTGRFSLMLGTTTGAMCLGSTVSGYLGSSWAGNYGYPAAFKYLGFTSLIPLFLYAMFVPETLPTCAVPKPKRRKHTQDVLKRLQEQRFSLHSALVAKANKSRKEGNFELV